MNEQQIRAAIAALQALLPTRPTDAEIADFFLTESAEGDETDDTTAVVTVRHFTGTKASSSDIHDFYLRYDGGATDSIIAAVRHFGG